MTLVNTIQIFREAIGLNDAVAKRVFETRDIVKRLTVISKKHISISKIPSEEATAVFNPGIAIFNNYVYLYPRVILGYFLYVSAIAEVKIPIVDVLENDVEGKKYKAKIVIVPDNRYDIWGTEDPRIYVLDDKLAMTYTGRTKYYFDNGIKTNKTFPITAFREALPNKEGDNKYWHKKYIHVPIEHVRNRLISDKDAFMYRLRTGNELYLFHRPHFIENSFYTLISKIKFTDKKVNGIKETIYNNGIVVFKASSFEKKIGWSTPPIQLNDRELIVFLHGVDNDIETYRLFAAHIEFDKEDIIVKAVTPTYIMAPKEDYEKFGDRPQTIFPCGIWPLNREEYLISYGAGDYFSGIGMININDLLGELDKGRIYE
ncbi:glycosidase [Staphylothermus hellenicus]|uniref:Glycosidase PH1107-related protein n=1 Tax=Staphylothermus hellenicus (strain DSM 12710 / JCM 10830 / BK20S6-10-b1 / P8) TaxID=591019 RepID=D7DCE2_STAHD|nr:glycosidase [Staphylothermus hellenicus]ADI31839.1 glycosidase PH1107-related protein [Staphylothermus hellenicus DSM 12710]